MHIFKAVWLISIYLFYSGLLLNISAWNSVHINFSESLFYPKYNGPTTVKHKIWCFLRNDNFSRPRNSFLPFFFLSLQVSHKWKTRLTNAKNERSDLNNYCRYSFLHNNHDDKGTSQLTAAKKMKNEYQLFRKEKKKNALNEIRRREIFSAKLKRLEEKEKTH